MGSEPRVQQDVHNKTAAHQMSLDEVYAQRQRMLDEMRGANQERKYIVEWLRSEACFDWLRQNTGGFVVGQAQDLADAIEYGEHHKKE